MEQRCPRCGLEMMERRDPSTGTWFLVCIRTPACAGWLPLAVQPVVVETWHPVKPGKRAGGIASILYLLEAHVGRPLTQTERWLIASGIVLLVAAAVMTMFVGGMPSMNDWGGTFSEP